MADMKGRASGVKRRLALGGCVAAAALMIGWNTWAAEAPKVVTSIAPVHSLVAGVMEGVGEPDLLVRGGGSPHSYSLRPSEAQALQQADLVFWIGDDMEVFLRKPLEALAGNAEVVELAEAPGIRLLNNREGGAWEGHDHHGEEGHDEHAHDDHGHDDHAHDEHAHDEHAEAKHDHGEHAHDDHGHDDHAHDDHAHDKHGHDDQAHDDHAHDDHAHDEHDHAEHAHEGHAHGEKNLHIWLDPHNAKRIVEAAVAELSKQDPAHAARYKSNGEAVLAQLDALDAELASTMESVRDLPFIVFHDAYHYFEDRYGLNAAGSITVSPDRAPGAKRLSEIREKVANAGAVCVFSEPQFEPALVDTVVQGTAARTGVLDPLGAEIEPGPDAYETLLRNLANDLQDCLRPSS